ncbi:MAG: alkaline phosphatase [Bacteroidales bacterium]|jgi:alkaline phosphatase|nr:alkaline phosphatase [Bacteroidales bacterium]
MRKKTIRNAAFIITLLSVQLLAFNTTEVKAAGKKPRNIILFIGDGMGTAQVYSAMSASDTPLFLERFSYAGFSKTFSADNYITDSAAGGTAIACGTKTNNGMIGVTPGLTAVSSITEIAQKNGLATGILSTSAVTHATPASFVAHNPGRGNYEEIAKDFLSGTADVFIGGGEDHFRNRSDGADLTVSLREQGYDVVYTLDDLKKSRSEKIAALLAKEHMPPASDGRAGMLREMTIQAIRLLSQDKDGFFLMIEGSMIDWACHEKDIDYSISETLDMDEAIGAALEFAEKDKKTLIVVTADHETGGLTLTGGNMNNKTVRAEFIETGSHTGVMVPVFSYGPGAARFSGINDNTFFFNEFISLLRLRK